MEKCRSPLPVLGSCFRRFGGVDRDESKLEAAAAAIVNMLKSLKSPPLKDDSDLIFRIEALGFEAEFVPDPVLRIVFMVLIGENTNVFNCERLRKAKELARSRVLVGERFGHFAGVHLAGDQDSRNIPRNFLLLPRSRNKCIGSELA